MLEGFTQAAHRLPRFVGSVSSEGLLLYMHPTGPGAYRYYSLAAGGLGLPALESALTAEVARATAAEEALSVSLDALQTEAADIQTLLDTYGTVVTYDTGTDAGDVPVLGDGGKLPLATIPENAFNLDGGTL